ncbi:MAG: hypothetical protein DRI61_13570, partial [Chloroflexi bacterium]
YIMFKFDNKHNITISNLQIDGNRNNQGTYNLTPALIQGYSAYDIRILNIHAHHSKGDTIEVGGERIWIENCHLHNGTEHEIHLSGAKKAFVINNYLHDNDAQLFSFGHANSEKVIVTNNILENTSHEAIYFPDDACNDIIFSNNYFRNVYWAIRTQVACTNLLISNNIFVDSDYYAIELAGGSTECIIQNNIFYSCDKAIYANGNRILVSGNIIKATPEQGIVLGGSCNTIINNYIEAGWGSYYPVSITGTYIKISHNIIRQGGTSANYLIFEDGSADYNEITNNNLRVGNPTISAIKRIGSHTIVKENLGYTTENSGSYEITGDGTNTSFTISHGLATTPTNIIITPTNASMASADWYVSSWDATNFTITFTSAPASGTKLSFKWYAEV